MIKFKKGATYFEKIDGYIVGLFKIITKQRWYFIAENINTKKQLKFRINSDGDMAFAINTDGQITWLLAGDENLVGNIIKQI